MNRYLITFLGALLLVACAPAEFKLPPNPSLSAASQAPVAPPLQREDPSDKVPMPVAADEARVSDWGIGPSPRIAVLPVDVLEKHIAPSSVPVGGAIAELVGEEMASDVGSFLVRLMMKSADGGDPGVAATKVERMLPILLLRSGYDRFVGPEQLRAISVEKQAQRGGTVTWKASLARLMQVEPISEVDLQIGIRVLNAASKKVEVEVGYLLDEEQQQAYADAYGSYAPVAEKELLNLRARRQTYAKTVADARAEYERKGGEYSEVEPTDGDRALAEAKEVLQQLDGRIALLEQQLAETVPPDELATMVAERRERVEVEAFDFAVRVRVVEASSLRVLWVADLGTRDLTADKAMERVLQHVIDQLPPAASQ